MWCCVTDGVGNINDAMVPTQRSLALVCLRFNGGGVRLRQNTAPVWFWGLG